jgi:hypothetical protein
MTNECSNAQNPNDEERALGGWCCFVPPNAWEVVAWDRRGKVPSRRTLPAQSKACGANSLKLAKTLILKFF